MVTITSHIFINIFQTKHLSAVKFAVGYEKNMSFLEIAKSSKVWNKVEKIGLGSFNMFKSRPIWKVVNFQYHPPTLVRSTRTVFLWKVGPVSHLVYKMVNSQNQVPTSLCQRLSLTRSVKNKPRARSTSIERQRRESPPEAKNERNESFAGGARGFAKQTLSPLHHEGANTQIKS